MEYQTRGKGIRGLKTAGLLFMLVHARKCCKLLKIFLCLVKLFSDSFCLLYLIFKCFDVRLSLSVKSSMSVLMSVWNCFVSIYVVIHTINCLLKYIDNNNKLIRISDIRNQTCWYRYAIMQKIFKNVRVITLDVKHKYSVCASYPKLQHSLFDNNLNIFGHLFSHDFNHSQPAYRTMLVERPWNQNCDSIHSAKERRSLWFRTSNFGLFYWCLSVWEGWGG